MPDASETSSHWAIGLWDLTNRVRVASCTSCDGKFCYVLKCDKTFVTPMGRTHDFITRCRRRCSGIDLCLRRICTGAPFAGGHLTKIALGRTHDFITRCRRRCSGIDLCSGNRLHTAKCGDCTHAGTLRRTQDFTQQSVGTALML